MNFRRVLFAIMAVMPFLAQAQIGTWTNTGPIQFPVNVSGQVHGMGRVSQLKFHVSNPAKMYAVSASGGLFISSDTGNTWAPTSGTEVLPTTGCSAVCVDYTNDNIMYLSTGDQNYYSDWYGIYKTTDGGATWNPANTGIGNRMAVEIIMDPQNHNTLIAATSDGIWKTTNGGTSWTQTFIGGTFKSLKQRPGSNNVLYAATNNKFYRSTNMGTTWTNITAGVVVPSGNEGIRIAVTPADTNIVVLGTTDGYGQILKSTNGGTSFTNIYTSTTQCIVCYDSNITSGSQGYYNFNLTINPANANELLLVSHCVWRSTDGGQTWSWRTQWWNQVHTDMHDIEFYPYDLNMRFNANDGGVWLSRDTLATIWTTRSNGLAATEMYHGAQSPVIRDLISAGTQDNGELYYDGIWKCNRGGDWGARCGISYRPDNAVYYDGGSRRQLIPLGGDQSYNAPFTTTPEFHIEFNRKMQNLAFIGTDSIWRSTNIDAGAPAWTLLFQNGENIMGLVSCMADSNILYAVTDGNHVMRSDNALAATPTFTTLSAPSSTWVNASIATNKYNPNIVYVTCGQNIYRSANKGVSWTNITGALPALNIKKVICDEYNTNERLFVCLGNYVYWKDNTHPWTLTTGLPTVMSITDMMIYNDSSSASILRLSTYGRGAWELNINNNMPPTGVFASNKQVICTPDTVRFHKTLFGSYTSFQWLFPGGTPATSTADSPVVIYNAPGSYDVSLIVTGAGGSDTVTIPGYIHASNGSSASIAEGFEGTAFPPVGWSQQSASGTMWTQTATAGGFGTSTHSIVFDNFNNSTDGARDRILLPKTNLSFATSAYMTFDVAYAYYPGYRDSLLVEVSTDCGRNFSAVYAKDTDWLATAPNNTSAFTPAATEWRTDTVWLTPYLGDRIQIAITNVGHYGQLIYVDNVNLHIVAPPDAVNGVTKIDNNLEVYPNPTNGMATIKAGNMLDGKVYITCYNTLGSIVAQQQEQATNGSIQTTLDLSALPRGIYEVRVQQQGSAANVKKILVQ